MNPSLRRSPFFLLLLAFVAMAIALPMPAKAQDTGVRATVGANVISLQSGPGLEFSSVGTARLNQTFPVIGRARGSNRVWYKIQLPSGDTAWVSERVVNVDPSPDSVSLPWLGDNLAKTPLVMDCGRVRPILFVGSFAQVIAPQGVILYKEIGIGKKQVGGAPVKAFVEILDGPFCTLLNTYRYQTQWLVVNQSGVTGYMLESLPNGKSPFVKISSDVSAKDFPAVVTPDPASTTPSAADRPANITDADIQAVMDTFDGVQSGKLNEKQAGTKLQNFVGNRSSVTLAWIVRRVPIYDGNTHGWFSFARYQDSTVMNFNLTSELDIHPVQTVLAILFGKYKDPVQILESIGCGGG
ncbi:MAG: SH3 domain-containing protein [Chloroflexota bacterium]